MSPLSRFGIALALIGAIAIPAAIGSTTGPKLVAQVPATGYRPAMCPGGYEHIPGTKLCRW